EVAGDLAREIVPHPRDVGLELLAKRRILVLEAREHAPHVLGPGFATPPRPGAEAGVAAVEPGPPERLGRLVSGRAQLGPAEPRERLAELLLDGGDGLLVGPRLDGFDLLGRQRCAHGSWSASATDALARRPEGEVVRGAAFAGHLWEYIVTRAPPR